MREIDFYNKYPEDWEDEQKYPNKDLEYVSPEEDYKQEVYIVTFNGKSYVPDTSKPSKTAFVNVIDEIWSYDDPSNKINRRGTKLFAKCPVCGSYHIETSRNKDVPDNIPSDVEYRSYRCNDCGFSISKPIEQK